ncbi:MAG: 50S ribosomal protein L25/general stress protein Ctc [Eubacteriales bacterium]
MVEVKINARVRPSKTSSYKHSLRNKGIIPAVIYGEGITSQPIELDARDLETAIQKKGRNALINLVLKDKQGENKYVVMVKEIQRSPIRRELVHVDLCKISLKDKLHTSVSVSLKGEARGLVNGGVIQSGLREIEIECMPAKIPDTISLDISPLDIGDHLSVADIPESPDFKILTEPEAVLVTMIASRMAEQPETTGAEGPAVAPAPRQGNEQEEKDE